MILYRIQFEKLLDTEFQRCRSLSAGLRWLRLRNWTILICHRQTRGAADAQGDAMFSPTGSSDNSDALNPSKIDVA